MKTSHLQKHCHWFYFSSHLFTKTSLQLRHTQHYKKLYEVGETLLYLTISLVAFTDQLVDFF